MYTTDQSWFGMRCYMKDAIGNWHVSPSISIGQYSSQREGAPIEESQTELPGFELNAYPNPYAISFTIAFDVPEENSHVRLDIVNSQGTVLKTVVENPHAKGKWRYEVKELLDNVTEVLYCRLKVNESYTIRKLLRISK